MASAYKGDPHDLRIVLLGVSGAGKSSIGNAILGREVFKESRTRESEIQRGRVEDRNISIIDTPGFFNTQLTDEEMKQQMMKSLFLSDPGPHVFLLIVNLENFREEKRNIVEKFLEIFGAQALKFTMVLFTGQEKMSKKERVTFKFSGTFQDLVSHCRNNYHVINSKTVIDQTNITTILDMINEIKQNNGPNYEIYFKYLIKSRKEKKKQEEEKDRKKEQETQQIKTVQEKNKLHTLKERDTANVVTEKKDFISHVTKNTERTQDRWSRVPQKSKNDEEEVVKQSVKSLRSSIKKTGENIGQKPENCWKKSGTGLLVQKKQPTATEQQSTPTVSESIQHRNMKLGESTDLRIVMVGKTGAGKSASGNTILGRKAFKEELFSESVTKKCQQQQQQTVDGRIISVIDTPGLFDTKISEAKLKDEIEKCVHMSVPGPHAFLLVIRLDVKYTEEEKHTVKLIQKNFGEDAACYTIVLFTRGDQLDKPIEEFLTKHKQINELVKQCKGGYHVFDNKDEENRTQVTELLEKIKIMVMKNGGEHYTNEMYKEAQRKIEEEEKKQREEEERKKLEEEEKIKEDERMRLWNNFTETVLLGAGIVGAGVGGAALAATGGASLRSALLSGAMAAGCALLASAGLTLVESLIIGAVAVGSAGLLFSICGLPLPRALIKRGIAAAISKFQISVSLRDSYT